MHNILHSFKQYLLHVFDRVHFLANAQHFTFLQTIFVTCIWQGTSSGQCTTFYIPSNNICYMYLPVYIFWPMHNILHSLNNFWPTHYILHSFKQYLLHMYSTVYIFCPIALHFTFLQTIFVTHVFDGVHFLANCITFYIPSNNICYTCIRLCSFSGQHIKFYIPSTIFVTWQSIFCGQYIPIPSFINICYLTVYIFWSTHTFHYILHSFNNTYLLFDNVHFMAIPFHFTSVTNIGYLTVYIFWPTDISNI